MAVTYLAKENYWISRLLYNTLKINEEGYDVQFLLMQLKGMLITPYVLHNEWRHKIVGEIAHQYFIEKYVQMIHNWLELMVKRDRKSTRLNSSHVATSYAVFCLKK